MTLRTVGVKLQAEVSSYVSNIQRAGKATADFKSQLDGAAKKGNLDAVADKAALAGAGMLGLAAAAFKSAADFDKSMSQVRAATHASSDEINKLRAAALQAGKDTSFSATQAADGITELSKAGVSTANILGGGLKGALDLAAAGQLGVGEAAEISASALTQFKLSGAQVPHVADLLAAAAGKAQGSVHDMGAALNQSGLVAAQFGISIEDTTGVLAEFASAGLIGSDAGTSFKTMLLALANPSKQTAKQMQELGINFYDAQGKFVGVSGVAQILQDKLKGLTQEQRNAALGQIFGNDAIRAASILYTDGAKGVDKWKGAVNDAGYASETAKIQTDNLAGDIERLKGSLETLAIQAGSGGNSGLRVLAKGLNDIVDQFANMPPATSSTITILGVVGGAALIGLAAFVKLRKGLAEAVLQLEAMGPAGVTAAGGLQKVAGVAGGLMLAFTAIEAGTAILNSFTKSSADVDRLTDSLTNFANTGKVSGEAADKFGIDLSGINKDAAVATSGMAQTISKGNDMLPVLGGLIDATVKLGANLAGKDDYKTAVANFGALDTALTSSMTTTNDAAKAQALWSEVLSKSGLDTEQLAKLLPNAYKEIGALNTAAMKAKDSTAGLGGAAKGTTGALTDQTKATNALVDENGKYKSATDASKGAILHQTDALKQLSNFMRAQADPVFALIQGQRDLKKAQNDANDAIDHYGAKSKQAKDATNKLAGAAIDLQGDVGALGGQFDGKMTPALKNTLKAAGLTDSQIKILTGEFKDAKKAADQYDGKYNAAVSVTGAPAVNKALDQLLVKQYALAKGLTPAAAQASVQKDMDRNNQKAYHAGGWTGPGGMYDEAGVVHADEHVIKKASRRKIEAKYPGALDAMNQTGDIPEWVGDRAGYAGGGRVWPMPTTASKTKIPTLAQVLGASGGVAGGSFGHWPSSPGAQRGDSGVWRNIVALVKSSGIPYEFGNAYRPGDPLWHGSGRAVDFMGFNQDRLAQFFMARKGSVLELIHRSDSADYGVTRGHNAPMPHQWPLHRNHLHVAMKNGGTITEPITGVGASGRTYSFGENYQPEKVIPNWQAGNGGGGISATIVLENHGVIGSQLEVENMLTGAIDNLRRKGRF